MAEMKKELMLDINLDIDAVFTMMDAGIKSIKYKKISVPFSPSLKVFRLKGTDCVSCGIKATHFNLSRPKNSTIYQIGMYSGKIQMTKDHILAKCLGGNDSLDNLQVMCLPCNSKKSYLENAIKIAKEAPLMYAQMILDAAMTRVAELTPKVNMAGSSNA